MEKELPEWLKVMLNSKELTGAEYDHVWTLLQLIKPVNSSNNQRTWTDEYELNGKKYNVTYGLEDNPIIEEIIK